MIMQLATELFMQNFSGQHHSLTDIQTLKKKRECRNLLDIPS